MASLLGKITAGALAGAAGVLAMDLVWYRRSQQDGNGQNFSEWEFSASTDSFEEASAPGQVGKKAANAVGIELPDEAAGVTTNVVHWLTGVGYGIQHGLVHHDHNPVLGGLASGATAFANSYAMMGALGIYDPIWEYEPETLWKDFSAHLAFGLATGLTYSLLSGNGDDEDA